MDRVSAGSISAENMAIAIYGNVQPAVFKHHMTMASTDGLVQRFIPVLVDGDKNAMWQDDVPPFATHRAAYDTLIRYLASLQPTEYTLTPEARIEFREFCQWYLTLRKAETVIRASDTYMTALGKSEGTCLRLALIFHLIQTPSEIKVTGTTMKQATNCMKQFIVPSIKYSFAEVARVGATLSEWITEHIIQLAGVKESVTLADLKRSARRQTEEFTTIEAELEIRYVMADLEDAGYVLQIDSGNIRSIAWAINPAIANQFKEYRETVVKARQDTIDIFNEYCEKKTGIRGNRKAIGLESM